MIHKSAQPILASIALAALLLQILIVPLTFADEAISEGTSVATTFTETASADTSTDTSTSAQTEESTVPSAHESTDSAHAQESSAQLATESEETMESTSTSASSSEPLIDPASPSAEREHVEDTASSTASGFVDPGFASTTLESATSTLESEDASSTSTTSENATSTEGSGGDAGGSSNLAATTSNPTIVSGTAIALANILNFLNTSFVNSNGGLLVSNFLAEAPTIDLRDVSLFSGMCGPVPCMGSGGIQLNLLNDAVINNDIILSALSGRNFASGAIGSSSTQSIETGNAFAGLNLINLANTTFVDSNYLLVTLNAFSGVNGDIVFPSLKKFFSATTGSSSVADGSSFTNDASVENHVAAGAESGGNTAEGTENSAIASGESGAYANVFNQINSILPESRISILFRISGTWRGTMYGVPDNVSQIRGPDGSIFLFGASSTQSGARANLIQSTSTAAINNNVQVSALSGENAIRNASTSLISTGNAFAGANIINIANQNVIGKNWILAIINIFGDFDGDISFGRPDLWVGSQAEAPGSLRNGSDVVYKITVLNNGDSDAHDITLEESIDPHIDVTDSSLPFETKDGKLTWHIDSLAPGGGFEVSYTGRVKDAGENTAITNTSVVSGTPSDNNLKDNTDSVTIHTSVNPVNGGFTGPMSSFTGSVSPTVLGTSTPKKASRLTVERTTEHMLATPNEPRVSEFVLVRNPGDVPIENTIFRDVLRDPSGEILHVEEWHLDTIAPHEEITINYTIVFATSTPTGIYTLSTELDNKSGKPSIYANGSITFMSGAPETGAPTKVPPIEIVGRKATVEPTAATTTQSHVDTSHNVALTAAAAGADPKAARRFIDLALFLLLFTTSYGALRLFSAPARFLPF